MYILSANSFKCQNVCSSLISLSVAYRAVFGHVRCRAILLNLHTAFSEQDSWQWCNFTVKLQCR